MSLGGVSLISLRLCILPSTLRLSILSSTFPRFPRQVFHLSPAVRVFPQIELPNSPLPPSPPLDVNSPLTSSPSPLPLHFFTFPIIPSISYLISLPFTIPFFRSFLFPLPFPLPFPFISPLTLQPLRNLRKLRLEGAWTCRPRL